MDYPIYKMFKRIETAIKKYPQAAMFELYDKGYTSLFEQLISCIISIRTRDETTIPISLRLFERARTPKEITDIGKPALEAILHGSTFPGQKADTMMAIAKKAQEHKSIPADYDWLTAIKGVGPKCANLALGIANNIAAISVDVHVHRVVNRWGIIAEATPEKTLPALENIIPQNQWIDVNRLLMPFGKHICTAHLPCCSTCTVAEWCKRIGVAAHR